MLDKYIKIDEKVIESKQTASGLWYCASCKTDTVAETERIIGQLNAIYNKYNKVIERSEKKEGKK